MTSMIDVTLVEYLALFTAFVSSLAACALIVLTQHWHGRLSLDHDLQGAQKFHAVPVPRIGGVALIVGLIVSALVYAQVSPNADDDQVLRLILAGLPAFGAGLLEDITKRVSIKSRLMATFASAALAVWLLDAQLTRLDTFMLDDLMLYAPAAILFTCFAVGGMANAVNIIDGFNGLAALSAVLMLIGLAAMAAWANDILVFKLCLAGVAALIGFLCLNFPFGKIFLGDGGAYLLGFWIAECAVLLLNRNPEVSTWAVLLCCIYPVWETFFSMWRKSVVRKTGMGQPDKLHFHMLVYRRGTRRVLPPGTPNWQRHLVTTLCISALVACVQLLASALQYHSANNHMAFMAAIGVFVLAYMAIYRSMTIRMSDDVESAESPLPNIN
jgi:UDP-N-acetylmuramyl pentapeptide phosphotransferase/UDP-N-acetylglucosamine-1-phosphate transferase